MEEYLYNKELSEIINYFIDNKLSKKSRFIMIKRHGLRGHEKLTLLDTGKYINLSRERTRQLQVFAEVKLKKYIEAHFSAI